MKASLAGLGILLASVVLAPASAQDESRQPSFDCAAATEPLEALICADPELAALDSEVAAAYRARRSQLAPAAEQALRVEQRAWAGHRAIACSVEAEPAIEVEAAISCLIALYRDRVAALRPGRGGEAAPVYASGYGWLMGDWSVAAVRAAPGDTVQKAETEGAIGRTLRFAETPISTLRGNSCSFPRYRAEPAPSAAFGDLSEFPTAVMVRVSCVGIALFDVVRLTEDRVLLAEGEGVFELERRR